MYFDHGVVPLILPDFSQAAAPTGELRAHMRAFFYLKLSDPYLYQMYLVTGIIGCLVIMGAAVGIWRLWEGSLWVFRIQPASRSNYSLIVPNTVMSFVLIEACFGIVFIIYIWCQIEAFEKGYDMAGQGPWLLVVWQLLFAGAWYGSVGTFYASPGVLSRRHLPAGGFDIAKLIPGPGVCNLFCVGMPIFVIISTGTVAVILGHHWHDTLREWEALDRALSGFDPSGAIPAGALEAALQVWEHWTLTWWYARVGYFIWAIWASLLFFFYLPAGAKLALTLKKQFEESRRAERDLQMTLQRRRKEREQKKQQLSPQGEAPVWNDAAEDEEDTSATTRRRNREAVAEAKRAAESTFYPPIRAARTEIDSNAAGPAVPVLRKSLINIIVMWSSISSAVASYAVLCVWISINMYRSSLQGPRELAESYMIYNLVAAWLACCFGGLNFVWITSRTFEPVIEGLQYKHGRTSEVVKSITTFFSSSKNQDHPDFAIGTRTGRFRNRRKSMGEALTAASNEDSHHSETPDVEDLAANEHTRPHEIAIDPSAASDSYERSLQSPFGTSHARKGSMGSRTTRDEEEGATTFQADPATRVPSYPEPSHHRGSPLRVDERSRADLRPKVSATSCNTTSPASCLRQARNSDEDSLELPSRSQVQIHIESPPPSPRRPSRGATQQQHQQQQPHHHHGLSPAEKGAKSRPSGRRPTARFDDQIHTFHRDDEL